MPIAVAVLVATLVSAVGAILAWRRTTRPDASKVADAAYVADLPHFADAPPGGLAKAEGTVAAIEGVALVEGPVSGAAGVWVKLTVAEDRAGDGETFAPIATVTETATAFTVGGVRVAASARIGTVTGDPRATSSGPVVEASARAQRFLARHGQDLASKDGFTRRRDYQESILLPGREVLVIGRKQRAAATASASGAAGGYRDAAVAASDELVVEALRFETEEAIRKAGRRGPFESGDLWILGLAFLFIGSTVGVGILAAVAALLE